MAEKTQKDCLYKDFTGWKIKIVEDKNSKIGAIKRLVAINNQTGEKEVLFNQTMSERVIEQYGCMSNTPEKQAEIEKYFKSVEYKLGKITQEEYNNFSPRKISGNFYAIIQNSPSNYTLIVYNHNNHKYSKLDNLNYATFVAEKDKEGYIYDQTDGVIITGKNGKYDVITPIDNFYELKGEFDNVAVDNNYHYHIENELRSVIYTLKHGNVNKLYVWNFGEILEKQKISKDDIIFSNAVAKEVFKYVHAIKKDGKYVLVGDEFYNHDTKYPSFSSKKSLIDYLDEEGRWEYDCFKNKEIIKEKYKKKLQHAKKYNYDQEDIDEILSDCKKELSDLVPLKPSTKQTIYQQAKKKLNKMFDNDLDEQNDILSN